MIEIFHHWRSSLTPYALFKPTIMAQVPFRIAQAAPITAQIGPAPIAALAFSSPVVFVMSADPSGGTICRKESSRVLRNSDPAPAPLLLLFSGIASPGMAQALIGLFGIAVQNGLVLVTQTRSLTDRGKPFEEAVREASIGRVRPKIMTAATAILGLLPILVLRLHGTEIGAPFGHCYDGRLDYVHHFYASCVADVLCRRSQVEQPLGDAAKLGTNDDSPQPQCCGIKGGGRFSLTNRGCLGRISRRGFSMLLGYPGGTPAVHAVEFLRGFTQPW